MKKSKLVCIAIPLVSSLFVGCTPIDVSNLGVTDQSGESQIESSAAETPEATDASSEADSASTAADSSVSDSEFYFEDLKQNEKKEVDLGNDGKTDELLLEIKDASCQVKINEQAIKIDIPVEGGVAYGTATAQFVHRSNGDYMLLEEAGDSGYGTVTLYKWDKDSMKEVDKIDDSVGVYYNYDEKGENRAYEIYADKVVIAKRCEVFGSWISTKNYTYGDDGLATEEKVEKLQPIIAGSDGGLILKKDVTFSDESGDAPKTAKAGDTIYPCEIRQNVIGFNSKAGEFLGYLPFEYNENDFTYSSDGVSEEELFENNLHVG